MPTYVYKFVETGETIEVQQGFHDENLTEIAHPDSGEILPVKKVFTPVGVTFKGSGFFKTDNRGKSSATTPSTSSTTADGKGGSASGSDGGSSSSDSTGSGTSSATKSDSSSSSGSGSSGSSASSGNGSGSSSS
jgi:predicted nucleic acid-binding Zn ribbon protein